MSIGYNVVEIEALDKVTFDFSSLNMWNSDASQRDTYHNSYIGYKGQPFGYELFTYDYNSNYDSLLSLCNHNMFFRYKTQSSFWQHSLHSKGTKMEDFRKF